MKTKFAFGLVVRILMTAILLLGISTLLFGQPFYGYTLYNPMDQYNTYLINMNSTTVKTWNTGTQGGYVVHLLGDGSIMRPCRASPIYLNGPAVAGRVQNISWTGTVTWTYTYSTTQHVTHHDIEVMPNGNVLLIAWEVKTAAQAQAAGRQNPTTMWPDHIIEVQPTGANTGNIVWEWHVWDHLIQDYNPAVANYGVVAQHPELLDINLHTGTGDWNHVNGISYNPELDQIVFSSHYMNEIYVIDHSTTTAQAASHTGGNSGKGGDFLYRWGKPSNYDAPGAQYFYVVHCAKWVPAGYPGEGNILAFNNGTNQNLSVVTEIVPPRDGYNYTWIPGTAYGPTTPVWTYSAAGFYSSNLGSCQRLPNGNTLCDEANSGDFVEVNSAGVSQWTFNSTSQIAKAYRYAWNYSGVVNLNALTLTMTAVNPPIQIPAGGGSFDFQVTAGNSVSSAPSFDFWTEVVLPNGTTYGPLYLRPNLVLAIGGTLSRQLTQSIPGGAPSGTYTYKAYVGDYPNFIDDYEEFTFVKLAVEEGKSAIGDWSLIGWDEDGTLIPTPEEYSLFTAYPNPFNPATIINFILPIAGNMKLAIYDVTGRELAVLLEGFYPAGTHNVTFDGSHLVSGVYFARLSWGNTQHILKLLLVK